MAGAMVARKVGMRVHASVARLAGLTAVDLADCWAVSMVAYLAGKMERGSAEMMVDAMAAPLVALMVHASVARLAGLTAVYLADWWAVWMAAY